MQAPGEQITSEPSATSLSSSSQNQQQRVKLCIPGRGRRRYALLRSPWIFNSSILLWAASHEIIFDHKTDFSTSRNHSAVHSALGASNATSRSVSFSSEHQHESLKFPESSVDDNPESLSSNDSNNGRANKLQNSESTVHKEDISTTHIGQEKACIKPLPRVEDTTANNALAGCKQALSLPTRHNTLLKSCPTIPHWYLLYLRPPHSIFRCLPWNRHIGQACRAEFWQTANRLH